MMSFFGNIGPKMSMSTADSKKFKNTGLSLSVNSFPCIDVYPPQDFKLADQNPSLGAIFLNDAIWRQGQQGAITITFGTFNCTGCSVKAAWSYIGNQSNQFSSQEMPSMNLGFCDPPQSGFSIDGYTFDISEFTDGTRNYCGPTECWPGWKPGATVLHEFGHALGMMHEHQNNSQRDNPLKLNVPVIKDYYTQLYGGDASAGDNAAQVNMIDRYTCDSAECDYQGSDFDLNSIMLYAIPDNWVVGENPTFPNFEYSSKDKEWLNMMYPINSTNRPKLSIRFLDGEPWQKYWVKKMVVEQLAPVVGIDFDFDLPVKVETASPTVAPTFAPTIPPVTIAPTFAPTMPPTMPPTLAPTTPPVVPVTTEPPVAETEAPVTFSPTEAPVAVTEEPTEPPTMPPIAPTITHGDTYKINWATSTGWYSWTDQLGYPRLQGNLPMFNSLTKQKQSQLMTSYFNVHPSGM